MKKTSAILAFILLFSSIHAQNYLWTWGSIISKMTYHLNYPSSWTYEYGYPVPMEKSPHGTWISITNTDTGSFSSTSAGVQENGTLWIWHYPGLNSPIPAQKGTETDWKTVSAGNSHFVALKDNGTIWSWSVATANQNHVGQLGRNGTIPFTEIGQIGSENNWKDIVANKDYVIALKTDGTIWAWGEVSNGVELLTPTQLGTDTDWSSITSSAAIKQNGTLWKRTSETYSQIGTDNNWKIVSSFQDRQYLALKENGTLWAFGLNHTGQLGIGNTTNQTNPVQVGSDSDWKQVSAGGNFSFAIKSNGTLWGWGQNNTNQLGLGDSYENGVNQLVPVQIGNDNDWISIDAGGFHTVAIKLSGYDEISYDEQFGSGTNPDPNVGVEDLYSNNAIKLFPNPAKDQLTVTGLKSGDNLSIVDLAGKEVHRIAATTDRIIIQTDKFNSGIYLLIIQNQLQSTTQKFVVKQD